MAEGQIGISKRNLTLWLAITALVLLAVWALASENFSQMFTALSQADYRMVSIAFAIYMVFILMWAARWDISLKAVGYRVKLQNLYLLIFSSRFINNITPFTYAGGDPLSRTYLLNKTEKVPYVAGFASTAVEIILDLPIFVSLLLVGLFMSSVALSKTMLALVGVVWIISLTLVFMGLSRMLKNRTGAKVAGKLIARILKLLRRKPNMRSISSGIERFYSGGSSIIGHPKTLAKVFSFSILLWIFSFIRLFFVFQAFGISPSPVMLLMAVTIPAIVGLVPLLPGSIGTFDAAMIWVFTSAGLSLDVAMAAVALDRMITFVFSTLAGAGTLSYQGIRLWKK